MTAANTNHIFTARESQIARHAAHEKTDGQISELLQLPVAMIKRYRQGIYDKTGTWDAASLRRWLQSLG
jgi:DNA-binding NarL/FixJ family response regulator